MFTAQAERTQSMSTRESWARRSTHLAADDVFVVGPKGLDQVGMLGERALAHVREDGVRLEHLVNVLLAEGATTQHTAEASEAVLAAAQGWDSLTLCRDRASRSDSARTIPPSCPSGPSHTSSGIPAMLSTKLQGGRPGSGHLHAGPPGNYLPLTTTSQLRDSRAQTTSCREEGQRRRGRGRRATHMPARQDMTLFL